MSTEARYVPTGEIQGDDRPMTDHGHSKSGNMNGSLGKASKSDLDKGFHAEGKLGDTGSDEGFA